MSVKRGLEDLSGTEGTKVVGSLPSGWSWRTLKDTTINFDGRRVPIKESDRAKRSGPYPYFGASGVIDDIDNYLFDGDFLLIAEDGANLLSRSSPVAFRASGKFWVNNHAHVVQVLSDVSQSFIEHYLNSIDLKFYVSGSAQPKLTQANLNKIPVPLPPLAEQKRIVAEIEKQFTRLEAGTAALRRVQANLKRYRAAVLKAACEGRLVPTEAELAKTEKRKAKFETGEQLLARILKERREKWAGRGEFAEPTNANQENLPVLPTGWAWATVEQISSVVRGASPRPAGDPRYFGGNVPWITVAPLTADTSPYLKSVTASLNEDGRERSRYIEADTLLLTNSGATLGVPKITLIGGCINDGVAALLDVSYPLKLYLLYFLRTQTERLRGVNQGAAQPNLNTTIIKNINVPLPPLAEQTRIVAEVERRLSVIEGLEAMVAANLQRAARLRQAVLQRAFSGQL